MEALKDAGLALLGAALFPVPTSQKKRDTVIQAYRDSVDYYKPLVEKRLDTKIGDIEVRDLSYMCTDKFYDGVDAALENEAMGKPIHIEIQNDANGYSYNVSFIMPKELNERQVRDIWSAHMVAYSIKRSVGWLLDGMRTKESYYSPESNTLYVSFAPLTRVNDFNIDGRLSSVAEESIHALSSAAWFTLGGDESLYGKKMMRQFANYCVNEYMSHLYPGGNGGGHASDNFVKMLVRQYGGMSMRDIPSSWEKMKLSPSPLDAPYADLLDMLD